MRERFFNERLQYSFYLCINIKGQMCNLSVYCLQLKLVIYLSDLVIERRVDILN